MSEGCFACGYDAAAVVTAEWAFYVPNQLPSQNAITKTDKWSYKRGRETWERYLLAIKMAHRIPDAFVPRRVIIWRAMGFRQSAFDRINYAGGCKQLLDALCRVRILKDDTVDWVLDYYPGQMKCGDVYRWEREIVKAPIFWIVPYDNVTGGVFVKVQELKRDPKR